MEFELLPETVNFDDDEITRIKEVLENGDLGPLTDFVYEEDTPGALQVTISTSDDDDSYDEFVDFRQQASSVLGVSQGQIGDITISVNPGSLVFDFDVLPESGSSFGQSDFNRITDALQTGELGPVYDLAYSTDTPGALDATVWTSDDEDAEDGDSQNYVISFGDNDQGVCSDIPPPSPSGKDWTCEDQKGWGKCSERWMWDNRYCETTCGFCGRNESPY